MKSQGSWIELAGLAEGRKIYFRKNQKTVDRLFEFDKVFALLRATPVGNVKNTVDDRRGGR